ncbi:flagellar biosynthetic protein FlhB [endosymbiont of Ridgeia piscesae]|jgi:flagellar biosynthetic protein FlhB|uniref:Flagellar biosynthetic protein FlhB n=2 Tax=endosymbiont of Ridgeia piscesae TaxID=54398 RepID=A0A0T5YYP9_9GAMM|nr:flagellar biosynthesis protein FlhB [endosymbiont of Ridgeia piscesae]KRT55629.1 flagellar biosynthetic protein FlhB [endosymbiont of Ridgeia piscesae]
MAENKDGQEKTEQPTAKRMSDSRRKGQVPRSRELNTMAVTLGGVITLVMMSGHFAKELRDIMSSGFTISRQEIFDVSSMLVRLTESLQSAFMMLLPYFLVMVVLAVASSVVLGGLAVSSENLMPKLSKLSPLKGIKRMFSAKALIEVVKAIAKFVLIGGLTVLLLWNTLENYLQLHEMDLHQGFDLISSLVGWSVILLASTLILIAAIDVPFQLWDHTRQLKMTRQEVRDEMKETEGRPEVKNRIRSLQREMAQRRMMEEVPKADVVVTNPTHYAVALRYDQDRMQAPKLVAKGSELVASNIRQVAGESQVPIIESPMLARAIYFSTELNESIPAGLYLAVAKLLAYVFQLKAYDEFGGEPPEVPEDLPVPEDLRHD